MECIEYATTVAILLSWFVSETLGNNCSKGVSWKDKTLYRRLRIQGEWIKFNCAIETSEKVTLWYGENMGETTEKLQVDNKKIKLIAENVFNMTNLTTNDEGWYTCEVCGKKHNSKLLKVSGQGKAYAKPIVEKKPKKTSYEIGGSVTLSCHVEGTTVPVYDIEWYKRLSSNGTFEKIKSERSVVKSIWTLTGSCELDGGAYMCKIYRKPLKYSATSELVNINVKDVSWKDKTSYRRVRIPSEWINFNCAFGTRTSEKVNLWFGDDIGKRTKKLQVDNKKIKLVSKNVFNITNLTRSDHGWYTCEVCGKTHTKLLKISGQGKAYANPIVKMKPNKTSYEIGGSVTLSCQVEGTTVSLYNIEWYRRLAPDEKFTKIKSEKRATKVIWTLTDLSERDEGTYMCKITRKPLRYSARALVNINVKDPLKPKIQIDEEVNYQTQGKDFLLPYNVTSYPASRIQWWRSKDGEHYEFITQCPPRPERYELIPRCLPRLEMCEEHSGKEKISNTSFEIKDLKYPQDEFFYMCNASNKYGNASKVFKLEVYVKPVILLHESTRVYKKGMIINCTLAKVDINPPQVNYTWYSCGPSKCNKKNLELISKSNSLRLESQSMPLRNYRCKAENAAGSAYQDLIVMQLANIKNSQKGNLLSIIVPIALISIIILVAASFVLYRRKKLYGGFYLFSYPPLPDYMAFLDKNGNIQDQLQKLPFIPEWEFPRERITLVSELGSGQFGMVWLADAIGISAFRPRDMLKERAGGRRLSSLFDRKGNRNNYIYCKEITQVAVKTVKDNHGRNDLADLQSELKILIHVGENENIVNILGACTKGESSDLYILMEYCPHGNLRKFLRNSRSRYSVEEKGLITDLSQVFGPKNLIHFGLQIAKGMKFLISRKVIHRDLAARNILIGQAYVAKVGDFGLARDVYKYQEYVRTSTGMVPFKWMALESIKDSIYTEQSDVWSFGVLLWELFTLGGTPYPAMSVSEVNEFLQKGKRMDPPVHCPQEICHVMSTCWAENPEERPDFSTLNETFSNILGFKPVTQESEVFDELKKGCPKENIELDYIQPNVDSEKEKIICVA